MSLPDLYDVKVVPESFGAAVAIDLKFKAQRLDPATGEVEYGNEKTLSEAANTDTETGITNIDNSAEKMYLIRGTLKVTPSVALDGTVKLFLVTRSGGGQLSDTPLSESLGSLTFTTGSALAQTLSFKSDG